MIKLLEAQEEQSEQIRSFSESDIKDAIMGVRNVKTDKIQYFVDKRVQFPEKLVDYIAHAIFECRDVMYDIVSIDCSLQNGNGWDLRVQDNSSGEDSVVRKTKPGASNKKRINYTGRLFIHCTNGVDLVFPLPTSVNFNLSKFLGNDSGFTQIIVGLNNPDTGAPINRETIVTYDNLSRNLRSALNVIRRNLKHKTSHHDSDVDVIRSRVIQSALDDASDVYNPYGISDELNKILPSASDADHRVDEIADEIEDDAREEFDWNAFTEPEKEELRKFYLGAFALQYKDLLDGGDGLNGTEILRDMKQNISNEYVTNHNFAYGDTSGEEEEERNAINNFVDTYAKYTLDNDSKYSRYESLSKKLQQLAESIQNVIDEVSDFDGDRQLYETYSLHSDLRSIKEGVLKWNENVKSHINIDPSESQNVLNEQVDWNPTKDLTDEKLDYYKSIISESIFKKNASEETGKFYFEKKEHPDMFLGLYGETKNKDKRLTFETEEEAVAYMNNISRFWRNVYELKSSD